MTEDSKVPPEPDLPRLHEAYSLYVKDDAQAIPMLENLAAADSVMSMDYLGSIYINGTMVPKDTEKAIYWFNKAYTLGSIEALLSLGKAYYFEKQYDRAAEIFSEGVDRNHVPSMRWLAHIYLMENKNPERAEQLLEAAASAGNVWAEKWLGQLLLLKKGGIKSYLKGRHLIIRAIIRGCVLYARNEHDIRLK